jgi:hypothetical protein
LRTPHIDVPGLAARTTPRGGRVAYLAADLDRRFGRDHLPDHADLLANLVRWAAGETIPLAVEGAGLVDCYLYRQPGRMVLHLVNLTSAGTWRAPVHELIPVGPLKVRVKPSPGVAGGRLTHRVAGRETTVGTAGGWVAFEVPTVVDHEVVIIA